MVLDTSISPCAGRRSQHESDIAKGEVLTMRELPASRVLAIRQVLHVHLQVLLRRSRRVRLWKIDS